MIKYWVKENFNGDYNDSMIARLESGLQLCNTDKNLDEDRRYFLNFLGISYNIAGDYAKALFYYQQRYLNAKENKKYRALVSSAINISVLLNELNNFDSSIQLLQYALSISGTIPQQSSLLANLAEAYAGKRQFDSAAIPLQKGFAILDTIKDKSGLDDRYAILYKTKAVIMQSQRQYATAIKAWQQSLVYTIKSSGSVFNRYAGKAFTGMAENFYSLHQYDSALYYYHRALGTVVAVDSSNLLSLPASKSIYAENTIMNALDGKAQTLTALYNQQHKPRQALTALDCYSLAFATENKLLAMYDYEQSKLLQLQSSRNRSRQAIALCNQLYKQSGNNNYSFIALQFAEKSKAIVLLQSIKKNLVAKNLSGNDTLLSKANSLQLRITRKEADIHEAQLKNDSSAAKFDAEKTKLIGELQTLHSQIKNAYPQLSKAVSIEDTITISNIKKNMLDTGIAIIEYFKADSATYAFYINANGNCTMQQLDKNIDSAAIGFTNFFQSPETITNNPAAYQSSAANMYRLLFPFTGFKPSQQLIIIPDGNIGYIPFEALITDTTTTQSLKQFHYLISQSNITEGYSLASLIKKNEPSSAGANLVAFAPVFSNCERNLAPLGFSKDELASIQNEFSNGKYFLYQNANINTLRSQATQCGILHIATHASANIKNSEPKIEMIDSTLTLGELYTWRMNAHLVTLSACETGIGNIEKSEGPMSLARGFYYAGAQNVINSLWQVNDAATGNIFNTFYKNIQNNTLSVSLQNAKLEYIRNSSNANASPYYWAGFVFIGSSGYQLPQQTNTSVWFAIAVIIIASALVLVMLYKKRKAAHSF
ncbi:MAG TPA: CHAT domain-containing protein [Panacibacter sp.]|nr:CHAT domain-containing protein [Panacibacter sp.]